MKLVVIATYLQPPRAHAARATLEARGIPARLHDEHSATWMPAYLGSEEGVKLLVPEESATEALRILGLIRDPTGALCPSCGLGRTVLRHARGVRAMTALLLLGGVGLVLSLIRLDQETFYWLISAGAVLLAVWVALAPRGNRYTCADCREKWMPRE